VTAAAPEPAAATAGQAAGVDPTAIEYRVHAYAYNTLTTMLAADDRFVPLSVRDAIALAIIDAIEPIIRADERERLRKQFARTERVDVDRHIL
jgi:hypothetical protein